MIGTGSRLSPPCGGERDQGEHVVLDDDDDDDDDDD